MNQNDSKYIVFDRERYMRQNGLAMEGEVPGEIADAVVIRKQDVFAPPALDMYANSIRITVEADRMMSNEPNPRATRLGEIADYFHRAANDSYEMNRKIPD